MTTRSLTILAAIAAIALGGTAPVAAAKHGSDDPATHHARDDRGRDSADDKGGTRGRKGKRRRGRGADDGPGHVRHGRHGDDGPNHT
jgi:hypothetical protein